MRVFRCCILFFCVMTASLSFAQKEDWQPITPQDLQIKEVPGNPGAPAIQLYYADYIDDSSHSEFYYERIKILNDKGTKYADVEIQIPPLGSITGLKARTIHPDGKIVEFSGKPFEKTIIKGKGIKYVAKTFTMPEATVGSIVEYKYKLIPPEGFIRDNSWVIQHDLYTVKESFRIKAYTGLLATKHGAESSQLSMVYSNMPASMKPQRKGDGFELEAENMKAFESEEYMPPADNYKPQVRFYYGGREMGSAEKFWQDTGHDWNEEVEHFIGNHKEIKAAAQEAMGNEADGDKQVRKLYARSQQIRNLTYERERTTEEQKKENIKDNSNVMDVLKHGYGDRSDIVLFFTALARSAGFQTSVVRAGNRQEHFFDKGFLSANQLDTDLAVVKVNGQDVYLDPGTKFCPYGLVRWIRTSTAGLKLDKNGGAFVVVPPAGYDKAVLRREAKLVLSEDGSLNGDLTVKFEGGEALEHRLDAFQTDEAGRNKDLETELQSWLPNTAIVKVKDAQGWETPDEPLTVHFTMQIPGYASAAGKRLLLPPYLFQMKHADAFKHAERKFPVYFPYAFSEIDAISIKFPSGYSMEGSPQNLQAKLPYAAYQIVGKLDGGQLLTQRVLLFHGIIFGKDQYPEVKEFFNQVQAGDEQQAVLRVGGTASAQKGN